MRVKAYEVLDECVGWERTLWSPGVMFDWEELGQTADKSQPGRPDRAGQQLEAAVGGQVRQLLLSGRGQTAEGL